MSEVVLAGKKVTVNEEGFLADAAAWTPELGEALAEAAGVRLTAEHWQVIHAARADAAQHGGEAPGLRRITQISGVSTKDLYRLFPKGPGKLAARIAGLPKPKSCL